MALDDLKSDDYKVALAASRDVLVAAIAAGEPQHMAALVKQLVAVVEKLHEGAPAKEGSTSDDLAAARAARRSAAKAGVSPNRRSQQRRTGSN